MKKLIISVSLLLLFIAFKTNANTWVIKASNYSFSPKSLNVSVGDTIKWKWEKGRHTTTSTTIPTGAAPWDTDLDSSNPTFIYVITVRGVYNFICTPHESSDDMIGTITAK